MEIRTVSDEKLEHLLGITRPLKEKQREKIVHLLLSVDTYTNQIQHVYTFMHNVHLR